MKKKQTAVEWLIDFFEDYYALLPVDIIEQAKAMEKEQIVNAVDGFPLQNRNLDGEQYYNETFAS
jgi:hypothetical protein